VKPLGGMIHVRHMCPAQRASHHAMPWGERLAVAGVEKSKGVERRRSAGRSACPRARAAGVRGLPRHDGADGGPGAHLRDRHRRRPAPDLPGPGARLRPAVPPRDHARAGAGGHWCARLPLDGPGGAAWGVRRILRGARRAGALCLRSRCWYGLPMSVRLWLSCCLGCRSCLRCAGGRPRRCARASHAPWPSPAVAMQTMIGRASR